MNRLYKITLHITLFLAITALPLTWLLTTNKGLKAILSAAQVISGTKIRHGTVHGSIIGNPIDIQDFNIELDGTNISVAKLHINLHGLSFIANNVHISDIDSLIPLIVTKVDGNIELKGHKQLLNLRAVGTAEQAIINATLKATHSSLGGWDINMLKATIKAKQLVLQGYHIKNLNTKIDMTNNIGDLLDITLNADSISINEDLINSINIAISGKLDKHTISAKATYNAIPIELYTTANVKSKTWHAEQLRLQLLGAQLNGAAKMLLDTRKLDASVSLSTDDLTLLMKWMPDVTRLKGKFAVEAKFTGALDAPVMTSTAHLTDITATIPSLGIKIKPMELHLVGDQDGIFNLTGAGSMRRGPGTFTLKGQIQPFKDSMPNSIQFIGDNIEFINNQTAQLIASLDVQMHYESASQRVDINGDVTINSGKITIADKSTHTVKSKDVVFINEPSLKSDKIINFNPDINLRIIEGVQFTGFGLQAEVSGKLAITQRHDAIYADGRVTIKEGTFQLPGQKLFINKGRLLYPPGTLLVNPVLDIKLHDQNEQLELAVQGTAQKMLITESGLASNKDRAMSQALLTGTSVISGNLLQDKLKISEIGLASHDEGNVEFFDDPGRNKSSFKNKDLVLGRPLGKKFYLQYLHSIGEANQRVRLKYSLNPFWDIGLESGTQGGGADLSFSIERD
jgi:autotransporter translocation and assembly factor TamB